ncbi:MmgE/PrpD family protein [Hydrogenophaga intermedia]|jgi:2-methylcitrate dehydratase PrpD|uniref:MmgE/PrpD family protein n=1 Tax=Hydrogenophaga intermedia TaxID=65786 RepID=UPI0020438CBD|nr:MmgE/PrpD family protein [Hydrogenophaga intermedia]MCM3563369.1 MmgE/PrpD family protein [Hydrogenophaga intermedia]
MPPNSFAALKLLARQARDMTIETIPAEVAHQARLCLLDSVGCMLAGTRTQEAELVMECEPALAAEAGATIVGTPHRRDWRGAVRVNGYLGDVLELNDLIGGHASIGVVSATMALAETLGSPGVRTVEALVRGIEVTARVYDSVYPSLKRYTDMALVPVGIPSTIGAAAAAACLLELDEDKTHHAMAIAAALAGWCPAEVIFGDGGTVKPMLFGAQPADTGVTAAWYARAGMTGPPAILDGKTGYFATASLEGKFDAEAWQARWALAEPRRKLHACCGYLHAPVDAVRQLIGRLGKLQSDGAIEVRVAPYVADVVAKDRPPQSSNDARFHLQFCVALAVCGADVILPEHSIELERQLQREDVRAAMGRIRVRPDATLNHYHHCAVETTDENGQNVSLALTSPRGSPKTPLTDEDVLTKFKVLAEPVIGVERARQFAQACEAIDRMSDTHALFALLQIPAGKDCR